jgi:hypothetical protein
MTLEEISFTYSSSSFGIRVIDSPNNYAIAMRNLLHHHWAPFSIMITSSQSKG